MSRLKKLILVGTVAAAACLTGCGSTPLMQNWIELNYASGPGPWPPLFAAGTSSQSKDQGSARIVEMTVWLDHVREFRFGFPDGHGVSSRNIALQDLIAHGGSLGTQQTSSRTNVQRLSWRSKEGLQLTFEIHMDRATILEVCAPVSYSSRVSPDVTLSTTQGQSFSMPLSYNDIVALFGEPSFTRQEFLVAKWRC